MRQRPSVRSGIASGDGDLPTGSPRAFHTLLAGLQEEYWAICRDRQKLQSENRELQQRLARTSACRSSSCRCHCGAEVRKSSGIYQSINGELAMVEAHSQNTNGELVVARDRSSSYMANGEVTMVAKSSSMGQTTNGEPVASAADVTVEILEDADDLSDGAGLPGGCASVTASDVDGPDSPVLYERSLNGRRRSRGKHTGQDGQDYGGSESGPSSEGTQEIDMAMMASGASMGGSYSSLFPDWWNPTVSHGMSTHMGVSAIFSMDQDATSRCMLSPVSRFRLLWDLAAALILLYETWAAPFRLIYLSEDVELPLMAVFDQVILVFFSTDIVLNFNTGVLERGKVNLVRSKAFHQYMRGWFWVDFFATFPFDYFLSGSGGMLTSLLRIFRFAKLFKTLRYLRLLKMKRALQSSEDGVAVMSTLKSLYMPAALLFSLLFLVHIYTCLWSALRHDQLKADDYYEAFVSYLEAFKDVYGTLYAFRQLELVTAPETIFDMAVSVHRIFFVICFASWVIFKTLLSFECTARLHMKTDHTLTYLRRHKVPAATQVQVLYGLYESGDAKEMQKDFAYLMESNLPTELQRTIIFQLWTPKLVSLGLIRIASSWHAQFVEELAMICFEEVFASSSALFREGDVGFSAYLVLSGELRIMSMVRTLANKDYKAGMWLGENALVNPTYRRGFSAFTMSLVSVMNVNSEGFWKVLEKLGLEKQFEDWCTKELWRGLCGRCGSVGDHFAHECVGNVQKVRNSLSGGGAAGAGGRRRMKEVKEYLKKNKLECLFPLLEELGIVDLVSLQELDLETLRQSAEQRNLNRPFSEMKTALSPSRIEKFRQTRQMGMKALLETQTKDHLVFISHYKVEAGTEAALMRSELQHALKAEHEGRVLPVPVFLDSDDLATLKDVQDRVKKSHNLILLLTTGVLTRPWVLVEIVTAYHLGINVQLVEVVKPGNAFKFPDHRYFQKLVGGQIMDQDSMEVMSQCNIDILEVEHCLREIFKSISVPYSPHRPDKIRQAELKALLGRCRLEYVAPEQARGAWARRLRKGSTTFNLRDT